MLQFDVEKLIRSMVKVGLDEDTSNEIAAGIDYDLADEEIISNEIRSWVGDELRFCKSEVLKNTITCTMMEINH
jgi:hypothetical protein